MRNNITVDTEVDQLTAALLSFRRAVKEAAEHGGTICISDEAKRLAEQHRAEESEIAEIASKLTREALRRGAGVTIGEAATAPPELTKA